MRTIRLVSRKATSTPLATSLRTVREEVASMAATSSTGRS